MSNLRPKTVKLLGSEHTIEYDTEDLDSSEQWGSYDANKRLIKIFQTKDDFDTWHTIFHEVIHGIEQKLELKLLTSEEGHKELDLLAYGIADFLLSNKLLKRTNKRQSE